MKITSEYIGTVRKDDKWDCYQYRVKLKRGERVAYVDFYQGMAHTDAPKLDDVMSCLLFDGSAADQSFEDWCSDCGYDTDSRRAYDTYKACKRNARKLAWLFPNGIPERLETRWRNV